MGMLALAKAAKVLPKVLIRNGHKVGFLLKKAKPEILVFGGAATVTGAFIWVIFNARKLNQALDEGQQKVEMIESRRSKIDDNDKPSIHEWEKELNKAKAESIWQIFYLIGLPSICFIGGMVMICGGHLILVQRFGALSSAFAVLQQNFNRYRKMNIEEHGEECDRRYLYGTGQAATAVATITDENGKVQEVKSYIPASAESGTSMYSFIFSEETSKKWNRDPLMNISFLKSQEYYWNQYLGIGKVVILREVLNDLGIELDPDDPRNDFVMIAGWRPNGEGDGSVDFGIMREINKPTLDLKDNYIVLDFNCDGNIYHSTRYTKDGKKVSCQGNTIKIEDGQRVAAYDTVKKKYGIYHNG